MQSTSSERGKQAAGEAALAFVQSGMRVGLGTGSTAYYTVQAVGEAWRDGRLKDIVVVPTSERTAAQARGYGLPIVDLGEVGELDVTIDGADEVSPALDLIKGKGNALLREKIVAVASRAMIVVADDSKLVPYLGAQTAVPVEVEPFGWQATLRELGALGCEAVLRLQGDAPYHTDGGHFTIDCRFLRIDDPARLEISIKKIPGALECGLFVKIAKRVLIGGPDGVGEVRVGGLRMKFTGP